MARDLLASSGRDLFAEPEASLAGAGSLALTAATGLVGQTVGGLHGIGRMVNPLAPRDTAGDVVRSTSEAFTADLTPEGRETLRAAVGAIPDSIIDAATAVAGGYNDVADWVAENVGPVAGTAFKVVPEFAIELMGYRGAKNILSRSKRAEKSFVKKSIQELAPTSQELRAASKAIYNDIDASGAVINARRFQRFAESVTDDAFKSGARPILTPKARQVIKEINKYVGDDVPVGETEMIRRMAQFAAGDPAESKIGATILKHVDDFQDSLKASDLVAGEAIDFNVKYRAARDLWRRHSRSEILMEAMENAEDAASGFENGIRMEMAKIARSPVKRRFFTKEEIGLMREIRRGNTAQNVTKLFGRVGFGERGATNLVGGALGITAGNYFLGPEGMVIVPAVGAVSRKLSQRLTMKRALFLDDVIRAGKDGEKIITAYYRHTPASERSAFELAQLLKRPDIYLPPSDRELVQQATGLTRLLRDHAAVAAGLGTAASQNPAFQATPETEAAQ